ncbi:TIGR03088 family PEP-CTERM/XrtA system glycosyltransferase [Duganella sp. P38]|uniref:TIGR03088 family PEP-CTERM/XrtA system glycosyltransferase n=1 Tax=Duganella sp. P38 TaxID=3423949 RepID=UPI003D798743
MTAPLVVHLIYKLDCGGMENLLIERINRMPPASYRHAVICLTDHTDFAQRIRRPGVELHALHKPPGLALATHAALYRLLRRLRPTILHSYNLSAIEYGPAAWLAGVPVRINGAHGRSAGDPTGSNRKHNLLRRLMLPFYDTCYANSAEMQQWNRNVIGVPQHKSALLPNGIDTERYRPASHDDGNRPLEQIFGPGHIVIGSVGRVEPVKNHGCLVDAFAALTARRPDLAPKLRLAIIGDGPQLPQLRARVQAAGLDAAAWLPGARSDVADILRGLAIFALPSVAEGTPGAALEAMASAVPVVGSDVGGVPEVVADGICGALVPPNDPAALSAALERYAAEPQLAAAHGAAGRARVQQRYAMTAMVAAYQGLYDELCKRKLKLKGQVESCAE